MIQTKVANDESEDNVENMLDEAMKQISEQGYADQYRASGMAIHVIAIVFGNEARNIVGFMVEA